MSDRDGKLLEAVGLSPIRVAYLLGISRQAVYEGLKREKHYFDGERVARIAGALDQQQDPKDTTLAASLQAAFDALSGEISRPTPQIAGRAGYSGQTDHDYRLVFARSPAELSDPQHLEGLMQSGLFTNARLLAYFLADQETARLLSQVIHHMISRHGGRHAPRVVIIETNLARALPDVTLTRTRAGDWTGQTRVVRSPGNTGAPLEAEYVARLKLLLDAAGFATNPSDSPNAFAPPLETTEYDGFTFGRLFDSFSAEPKGTLQETT